MRKVAVIRDPLFLTHKNGDAHPERPERLETISRLLAHADTDKFFGSYLTEVTAEDATFGQISLVHDAEYVSFVGETVQRDYTYFDPDTSANRNTYSAAVRAAGAAIAAVDTLFAGAASASFAFVRPPGHHAERNRAMGFCIFNNVAIAARYALERYTIERVAVVDWDVHHGNGTMNSFYDDKSCLYVSLHQHPYYPGTGGIDDIGIGEGEGYTMNIPLRSGRTDNDYLQLFRDLIVPVLHEYRPELILVSAGFDAHYADPLADMELTDAAYGRMTHVLREVADDHAAGRIAHVLEGGYNLRSLASGTQEVLRALSSDHAELDWMDELPESSEYIQGVVETVRQRLLPYWSCLKARVQRR